MNERFIQNSQLEIELQKQAESLLSPNDLKIIKIVRDCVEAKDALTHGQMSYEEYENFHFDLVDLIPGAFEAYDKLRIEIKKLRAQQPKTKIRM